MPRITFRDYLPDDRPSESIGDAGRAIAAGVLERTKQRREDEKLAEDRKLKEKQLAIEEERAKARTLFEANRAKLLGAKEAKEEADRQAAVQGLQELAGQQQKDAVEKALRAAIKSPSGALGPFGVLGSKFVVDAAKGLAGVQERMGPKIELAREMSPAAARQFLTRETQAEKQRAIAEGYQREAQAIMDAATEGVLDPAVAKQMTQALQDSIRSGRSPGAIHAQVAKAYDLDKKKKQRAAGWEDTDRKAGELIAMLETMASSAEIPSVREKLLQKVADAKGEWARTQYQTFRDKNDGPASLAGLEEILFGAQAANEELPSGITYTDPAAEEAKRQRDYALAVGPGEAGPEAAQAPSGVKRAPKRLEHHPERRSPLAGPYRPITPETKAKVGGEIERFVIDNGRKALMQGEDQAAAIEGMLRQMGKDLGLDPRDPFVEGAVASALLKLQEGELGPPKRAKPTAAVRDEDRSFGSLSREEQLASSPFP